MSHKEAFRVNNFDLIRLFAASEVALRHTLDRFGMADSWLCECTSWLPGVPIFFFVSGFLISKSYESNSRIGEYARNRILRIYPALILCVILAFVSVLITGYLATQSYTFSGIAVWLLAQMTFVQFYNPTFMRDFGTGVFNGSLWTVTVELQFYVLIPMIYWVLAWIVRRGMNLNMVLIGLILLFVLGNLGYQHLSESQPSAMTTKLFMVTFVPWLFMFLIGVLAQKNFVSIYRFIIGRTLPILLAYGCLTFFCVRFLGWKTGNEVHPALFPFLAIVVLALAYNAPTLADRILHKNDISYGVYIYHAPIINLMIFYGYATKTLDVIVALALTVTMAIISWLCLERIAIRKKKRPSMNMDAGSDPASQTHLG